MRTVVIASVFGILLCAGALSSAWGDPPSARVQDALEQATRPAPEFGAATMWLNTDKPLTLKQLRGQVVLIDFWTYCCINCMHVFPDLRFLEDKYRGQPFVVIGVHSGKFSAEKDPRNIRQAILRNGITHPVAVDSDFHIWKAFGVNAWPSLVLIDPDGNIVEKLSGEGNRDRLDKAVAILLDQYHKKGTLGQALMLRAEQVVSEPEELAFPGKVLADAGSNRLFVSDTNHHRILVADLDGHVHGVIGSSVVGLEDGDFLTARFHRPQGLALSADGHTLYVADTENHAIRAADFRAKRVRTVAGTGVQSTDRDAEGPALQTALNSPWDLALVGDKLYIAMAGSHQIWVLDLSAGSVAVFAGTGHEGRIDGPSREAAFAQPSGLATDGRVLYVADTEVSTIRAVSLGSNSQTTTIAGGGGLFEFGVRDGNGEQALFQHPLGVTLWDEKLFVADTFNHLIRLIDLKTREVTTWLGTGKAEKGTPQQIGLYEPGGVSVTNDTLYIADTNNHRILAVEIKSKKVRVLDVKVEPQVLTSAPSGLPVSKPAMN
ncbi:MAG TPA: thioredoxin-like domain-containing protein [Phycisphaerae bacterium]|nr:thioredoxin-like domain-containing protein [Phycisphaerae bacterium]